MIIISASNGKYFLLKTNANDNKTSQDYMRDDNRAGAGGCEPASVFLNTEVACKRGSVFGLQLQVKKPFNSFSKRVGSNCVEHAYPAARTPTECREEVIQMTVNKHFKESSELLRLNLILMLTSC